MSDSDSDNSIGIDPTFSAFFASRKKDPTQNNPQKESSSSSLLNKIDELKKQEERITVLTAQLEEPLEQLSQETIVIPTINGQLVFDTYKMKRHTVMKPGVSEFDIKECDLFSDLQQIIEAAYNETPDAFYIDIIQTDLLKELDAIHTLPASMYSMLFTIAVYCEDSVSSIRATDLLLTLLSSHSQYPLSFAMCLPPSEELYSVLTDYGFCEGGVDMVTLCSDHPELVSKLHSDGSLDLSLVEGFPITQLEHFFQILLLCLIRLQEEDCYFKLQELEGYLYRLLMCLLDPRMTILYDLVCNNLAAIVTSMQKRGFKMKQVLERVVSKESIPSVHSLGLLLLRIPIVNPTLEYLRSVLSFYVLKRLQWNCFFVIVPLFCLVIC